MILIKKLFLYFIKNYFDIFLIKKIFITLTIINILTFIRVQKPAQDELGTIHDALIATRYSDLILIHCEESKIFTFGSSDAMLTIKKKKQI